MIIIKARLASFLSILQILTEMAWVITNIKLYKEEKRIKKEIGSKEQIGGQEFILLSSFNPSPPDLACFRALLKFMKLPGVNFVSILSAPYSLKKNSGLGEGVANFRDQGRTCIGLMHIISRFISLISRLMFSVVDLYFLYSRLVLAKESWVLGFCQNSQLIFWDSRLIHIISRVILGYSRLTAIWQFPFLVLFSIWIGFKFSFFSEVMLIVLLKFVLD